MAAYLKTRARWNALNAFIAKAGGAITTLPLHFPILFEADYQSFAANVTLPGELQALGYSVKPIGTVQRLRPHATHEMIVTGRSSSPEYTISVSHPGFVHVCQWELNMPPLQDVTRKIPGAASKKQTTRIYEKSRREKIERARAKT